MITACYRLQYVNLHRIEFLLFHERFDSSFNQDLITIETHISPILMKDNLSKFYFDQIQINICFLFFVNLLLFLIFVTIFVYY